MLKKQIAAVLSIAVLCGAAIAADPTPKETAKAQVEELCKATTAWDYEKIADLTNPAVVKMMGGRKKMIADLTATMDALKEKGLTIVSMKVGEASDPVAAGDELYIVVTDEAVMKMPKMKLQQKSYVVGLSTDKGKTWTFVDGSVGEEMVREILPNLPKELKLPAREKPVMEDTEEGK